MLVSLALEGAIETDFPFPVTADQVEHANPSVVALRHIDGAVVRRHGDSQVKAVQAVVIVLGVRRNLHHLRRISVGIFYYRNRKWVAASVGGNESPTVGRKGQAVRVRCNANVAAGRHDDATVRNNRLTPGFDACRLISSRGVKLRRRSRRTWTRDHAEPSKTHSHNRSAKNSMS